MRIIELKPASREKYGRINKNGVDFKAHEEDTAKFLIKYGFNIEAIIPTHIKGNKNADILVNGAIWEMKSPIGSGRWTIRRQFQYAGGQASYLILDLRRAKVQKDRLKSEVLNCYKLSSSIRKLMIITPSNKLLDVKK